MLAVVSVARLVANELTKYEWLTHVVVGAANGDPVPPERHPDSPTSSMPPKRMRTWGRLGILGDEITQTLFGTVRGHKLVTNDLGSPRTGHLWGLRSSLKVPVSWTPLAAVVARIFDIDAGPLAARPLHRKRI
jgi:hypothetical protein